MRVNLDPLDGAAVPDALSVKEKMQQNQKCIILQPIGLFATDGHKVLNLPCRRASYALEHNNTKKIHALLVKITLFWRLSHSFCRPLSMKDFVRVPCNHYHLLQKAY